MMEVLTVLGSSGLSGRFCGAVEAQRDVMLEVDIPSDSDYNHVKTLIYHY